MAKGITYDETSAPLGKPSARATLGSCLSHGNTRPKERRESSGVSGYLWCRSDERAAPQVLSFR